MWGDFIVFYEAILFFCGPPKERKIFLKPPFGGKKFSNRKKKKPLMGLKTFPKDLLRVYPRSVICQKKFWPLKSPPTRNWSLYKVCTKRMVLNWSPKTKFKKLGLVWSPQNGLTIGGKILNKLWERKNFRITFLGP